MKVCLDCGLSPEAHHAFRERIAPPGCKCDPSEWTADTIPPVCDDYEAARSATFPDDYVDYCSTCEHDKSCHGETK
jgi:hypothetical protein